jgi:hypothetical protein
MVAAGLSLPIGPPLVRSYLFHAYPLSILAGLGPRTLPWILSTFVQLYQRPGSDLKFYLHPGSPAPHLRQVLASCPWLDVQQVDQRLVAPLTPFLERCLQRGLYAQVDVDYGCLPWDPRRRWLHEVLLHGVDRQAGFFEVRLYGADGRFHSRRLDRDTLEAAAAAAARLDDSGERPRLVLYRPLSPAGHEPDLGALCDLLWDYVEAADSSMRYRCLARPLPALWGIAAVDALADAVVEGPSTSLDIPLRTWWEHKHLMALRLAWLEGAGCIDPALHSAGQARGLADLAWKARLIALRHGRLDRHAASTLRSLIRESVARDLDVVGQVVRSLAGDARRQAA